MCEQRIDCVAQLFQGALLGDQLVDIFQDEKRGFANATPPGHDLVFVECGGKAPRKIGRVGDYDRAAIFVGPTAGKTAGDVRFACAGGPVEDQRVVRGRRVFEDRCDCLREQAMLGPGEEGEDSSVRLFVAVDVRDCLGLACVDRGMVTPSAGAASNGAKISSLRSTVSGMVKTSLTSAAPSTNWLRFLGQKIRLWRSRNFTSFRGFSRAAKGADFCWFFDGNKWPLARGIGELVLGALASDSTSARMHR